MIGDASAVPASLVAEGTGDPALSEAGRPGDEQVLVSADPGAVDEVGDGDGDGDCSGDGSDGGSGVGNGSGDGEGEGEGEGDGKGEGSGVSGYSFGPAVHVPSVVL